MSPSSTSQAIESSPYRKEETQSDELQEWERDRWMSCCFKVKNDPQQRAVTPSHESLSIFYVPTDTLRIKFGKKTQLIGWKASKLLPNLPRQIIHVASVFATQRYRERHAVRVCREDCGGDLYPELILHFEFKKGQKEMTYGISAVR